MSFEMDGLTLEELLDQSGDGSALIIHADRDNLANIPARYHAHVPDASSTTLGPDPATLATATPVLAPRAASSLAPATALAMATDGSQRAHSARASSTIRCSDSRRPPHARAPSSRGRIRRRSPRASRAE